MVANDATAKERIAALVETLPQEALAEVISFLEFQQFKLERTKSGEERPTPVKLGGLWAGVEITDEDIQSVRREMWEGLEDRFK